MNEKRQNDPTAQNETKLRLDAHSKEWNDMNALIEQIWNDSGDTDLGLFENPDAGALDGWHPKLQAFLAALQRQDLPERLTGGHSLLETWLSGQPQASWFLQMEQIWNQAKGSMKQMAEQWEGALLPLEAAMEHLMANRQLAPAVRNAQAEREYVYPARRRAIDTADLPMFHPLFCSAVCSSTSRFELNGLQPNANYTFLAISVADPAERVSLPVRTNPAGGASVDWSGIWPALTKRERGVAWFLHRDTMATSNSHDWTSGLVWPAEEQESKHNEPDSGERYSGSIDTLLQINRLLCGGYWVDAYECIRRNLLAVQSNDETQGFYPASLWKLAEQTIEAMLRRLRQAEPVFRSVRPEWNAVQALETLLYQIAERE